MCLARENRQLNKCHITLPLVGFFVIIIVERKKISPMKNLVKVVLGILVYNYTTNSFPRKKSRVGTVSNYDYDSFKIPNNGGL